VTKRGNPYQVDNGKWVARYEERNGKQHQKTFDLKRDAVAWIAKAREQISDGSHIDSEGSRTLFGDYVERWFAAQPYKPRTRLSHRSRLDSHILPRFATHPLHKILPTEVQGWVTDLEERYTGGTVRNSFNLLSSALDGATRDRLLRTNPAKGTSVPRFTTKKVIPLTVDQVRAIETVMPPRWGAAVVVGYGTGLRISEVLGLTTERVDFLRRELHVTHQLEVLPGRPPRLTPPKSKAGDRTIPLPTIVVDALAAHLAQFPATAVDLDVVDRGKPAHRETRHLIFTNDRSGPQPAGGFGRDVLSVAMTKVNRVGFPPGEVTFHAFRHHYASLLLQSRSVSIKALQEYLGHEDATVTLNTYGHLIPGTEDETRKAVDHAHRDRSQEKHDLGMTSETPHNQ
jgi:integrase